MTSNYFKVRGSPARFFWFNGADRASARKAFGKASATSGVLSVYMRPAVSGEWDTVPPIVPQNQWHPPRECLSFALPGEGGIW